MVVVKSLSLALLGLLAVLPTGQAHPGEEHNHAAIRREVKHLQTFASRSTKLLEKCSNNPSARALRERALSRRLATAQSLQGARSINAPVLHRRDLASLQAFEEVDHNATGSINYSDPSSIFSANTSCILAPEVTIGPYYVLGELVRQDLTDGRAGVPLHLEMQFIDVNTCKPVEDLLVDIWSCNATGTYSGVTSEGTLNETFLRGLQQSSSDGVVEFDTLFPGHYQGRATHEHLAVHTGTTLLPNGSFSGGEFSHIGQLFFEETLIDAVEATSPYSTNDAPRTTNDEDMIAQSQADNNNDPFMQYIYLDADDITAGLLGWIEIGIDTSANHSSSASWASYLAEDGGHENPNSGMGGGPGGPDGPGGSGGPGGPPSGGIPGSSTASAIASGTSSAIVSVYSSGAGQVHGLWRRFDGARRH
ncbi:aromatic compound dioxygenase [Eremomyces bilateralis CBS 781.70]|uniref:Aromatic compound dioxygenase n=1 Tax=Eremomyces bilateralis CBS 781.70 TaxID=1392243 RepID=A0A6G1G8Q1_9PEZI|nr:aromatic compound dioxygenase [Eremomyces bilateralis CBS 781.70]KAF1814403.1 aromatic compound dioxygenase [Eremomyces bilateralis CBS 781.70]